MSLSLQHYLLLTINDLSTQNAFKLYDKDNSGQLCSFELRQALNSAGYRLNNHVCDALMLRYGDRDGKVSFDDFIMCSVKLKTMMGKWKFKFLYSIGNLYVLRNVPPMWLILIYYRKRIFGSSLFLFNLYLMNKAKTISQESYTSEVD